ncbi:hypothetical protein TNCV_1142151 [Trichonephila clavipes]|nr:hypothetical protein TNCV_1142151 [Trichonephila clavipes]
MVLKANDRRTSCPCHDEFRGPRSDYVRQGPAKFSHGPPLWRLLIWGMFFWSISHALMFLEDKQTVMRYLDIMADQMHPAMWHFYPASDGYFMNDNATIHRTRSVQSWFVEHINLTSDTFPGHHLAQILTP